MAIFHVDISNERVRIIFLKLFLFPNQIIDSWLFNLHFYITFISFCLCLYWSATLAMCTSKNIYSNYNV